MLDAADIDGIVDDLGVVVRMEDGTEFRGVFRRDYQSEDMNDARVEGVISTLMVSGELTKALSMKKHSLLIIDNAQYGVRRIEPDVSGFARVVLIAK